MLHVSLGESLSTWQLVSEHDYEAGITGSNIEEISEQTRGRETKLIARGRGKKDKSCDAFANMEARLAKVELAMTDTWKGMNLI